MTPEVFNIYDTWGGEIYLTLVPKNTVYTQTRFTGCKGGDHSQVRLLNLCTVVKYPESKEMFPHSNH